MVVKNARLRMLAKFMFAKTRLVKIMIALTMSCAAHGDSLTATVPAGSTPVAVVTNPVTNKIVYYIGQGFFVAPPRGRVD